MKQKNKVILQALNVKKFFKKDSKHHLVLDHIDFSLFENEIVCLLGKSGSGKSTFLRIISGLTQPNEGQITWHGEPINKPIPGISMVFQNFALLPWLSVLQNVSLGLDALNLPEEEKRQRALTAIDQVGMDGFESAYPRELSGGMCQRVGIARAMAADPIVMLMDEPFSSLDVLTSENLRADLIDIWQSKRGRLQSMIMVTHNIEEAAAMADRIIVFSSDPGKIFSEIKVNISGERDEQNPEFRKLVDQIYQHMSQAQIKYKQSDVAQKTTPITSRLPSTPLSELTGILEILANAENENQYDLSEFAEDHLLDVDNLFTAVEALEMLGFARVRRGKILLTDEGYGFANADILKRKQMFSTQLLTHIELARYIRHELDKNADHEADKGMLIQHLERHFSVEIANEIFRIIVDWGRYAEIFAYDDRTEQLSLEDPK